MTRKTDKRFLASFTKPLFPLEEAHILPSVNTPRPTTATKKLLKRTLDFEMLYGVKSSVSFSHVHCDYGHAYLTCTIWSGKETMTNAFPLDFFIF